MKKNAGFLLALVLLATIHARAAEIMVFAASSLTDSLKEISSDYEKQSGDTVSFNFGASSMLERQIEQGAPADVFFSADEAKMNALEKKNLIKPATRRSCLGNSLVVVVPKDSNIRIVAPEDLAGGVAITRLALADPKAVPAGIYARKWLEKAGLWAKVQSKVIPTENVRAALAAVESGNVEAGIVYKTDAAISKKVRVAYQVPAKDGPDISYPVAVVKDSKEPEAAQKFVNYLTSNEAGNIFRRYGFTLRNQP